MVQHGEKDEEENFAAEREKSGGEKERRKTGRKLTSHEETEYYRGLFQAKWLKGETIYNEELITKWRITATNSEYYNLFRDFTL